MTFGAAPHAQSHQLWAALRPALVECVLETIVPESTRRELTSWKSTKLRGTQPDCA